jgi:hypothetical protein
MRSMPVLTNCADVDCPDFDFLQPPILFKSRLAGESR